ncbi:MAG: D-glycero-beta-D-manno-heptose-7-phosphate kinase [Thiohalocapsa sp. PB-PSB1]|jgi:D-beta-D-heptose 7-phosphate kinase/D-beta-D-heptose 1-phosphate adenosyltransferase|nr:MAG: hypothetical protein N838_24545 [Thiohalocapsa sp. PB-PSB1]QQO56692.1 MAG: D-glycero-beta-D-manno-heptose-7-phosphate kinase [Thiohalocapsa sp. PB-PSB1]HCS90209.1 D-glycero-beta-D-manno-heptose-7-phosphate kinase [Chromatiaceae bacterium]
MFLHFDQVIETVRGHFGGRRVLVLGDLMLDRYLWGDVRRISPEAPVPVLRLQRETEVAGGAANVARNLVGLGLEVCVCGITGRDSHRNRLLALLTEQGIDTDCVLIDATRPTTTKTRVIGDHQQMLRIDAECSGAIGADVAERLIQAFADRLAAVDLVLVSDYAKGVVTGDLCRRIIAMARRRDLPVLIDPKGKDFSRYRGATAITPNRGELALAAAVDAGDLDLLLSTAGRMREELGLEQLLLTLGALGIALLDATGVQRIPAAAQNVFDVSGAGDTVIATFAAGRAANLDTVDAAHLANVAASVVIAKLGTAAIVSNELIAAITDEAALEQAAKITSLADLVLRTQHWRDRNQRIVFTNGCFDLLHAGHVTYLERARRHGDRLVVGLNTDRSVRALKGPERPLIGEQDRARVLAALAAVDAVVLFDDDTPLDLIRALRPDVLAKGADYREQDIVGASDVKSWGGQVVLVPLVDGRSTSAIIQRMQP